MNEYFKEGRNQSELEELKEKAGQGVTLYTFDACPSCGYSVSPRKTMKPKYKCYRCKIEFDEPKKKIKQSTLLFLKKRFFQEFCKKHSEEIESILKPIKEKKDKEYLEFKDVMILCHRCNFARLKGMHLCPVCKEHYVKGSFSQCFTCYSKTDEYKKKKERELELEKEELENDFWETQIQYCGNCPNHIVSNFEIFCGLSPNQMCDHGFFEGDGVRIHISKGTGRMRKDD